MDNNSKILAGMLGTTDRQVQVSKMVQAASASVPEFQQSVDRIPSRTAIYREYAKRVNVARLREAILKKPHQREPRSDKE